MAGSQLTRETAGPLLDALAAGASAWRAIPLAERAGAIADAAKRLRRPDDALRLRALAECAAWTGRAEGMLADSLDFFLGKLGHDALLEEAKRCGLRSTAGALPDAPTVVLHWLAGNTPWAGLESMSVAVLAGSASLVKVARAEPLFASAWARALGEAHPILSDALAVLHWGGAEETALDEPVFAGVETLVAFGSDVTMRSLEARVARLPEARRPRIVPHGHRLSLIFLGEAAWQAETLERTAERVALDHVLEDQTGCLSPRAVLLVGDSTQAAGADAARRFAERVAAALEKEERRWPRAPIAPAEAARVQQLRESGRMRGAGVWVSPGSTAWTVLLDAAPAGGSPLEPAPEARFVQIVRWSSLEEAIEACRPVQGVLSTLAYDGLSEGALRRICEGLAPDRVCPPGTMQRPPLGWNHDGASDLAHLLGPREARGTEPVHDRRREAT